MKRAWVVEAVHFLMYSLSEQAAEMPDEATREKRRLLRERAVWSAAWLPLKDLRTCMCSVLG